MLTPTHQFTNSPTHQFHHQCFWSSAVTVAPFMAGDVTTCFTALRGAFATHSVVLPPSLELISTLNASKVPAATVTCSLPTTLSSFVLICRRCTSRLRNVVVYPSASGSVAIVSAEPDPSPNRSPPASTEIGRACPLIFISPTILPSLTSYSTLIGPCATDRLRTTRLPFAYVVLSVASPIGNLAVSVITHASPSSRMSVDEVTFIPCPPISLRAFT